MAEADDFEEGEDSLYQDEPTADDTDMVGGDFAVDYSGNAEDLLGSAGSGESQELEDEIHTLICRAKTEMGAKRILSEILQLTGGMVSNAGFYNNYNSALIRQGFKPASATRIIFEVSKLTLQCDATVTHTQGSVDTVSLRLTSSVNWVILRNLLFYIRTAHAEDQTDMEEAKLMEKTVLPSQYYDGKERDYDLSRSRIDPTHIVEAGVVLGFPNGVVTIAGEAFIQDYPNWDCKLSIIHPNIFVEHQASEDAFVQIIRTYSGGEQLSKLLTFAYSKRNEVLNITTTAEPQWRLFP